MSVATPAFRVTRWSVVGMEGMFAKMFDPPAEEPDTPDLVAPTNPVPEVMSAAGYQDTPSTAHTVQRDLMHGTKITTWDGLKDLVFFVFRDGDNPATSGGNYPAATIRVPRGVIFHGETDGHGPPPHTIHWHGIEPTPMNDGVGHCSMELGHYIYQWQPNFIGSYFYHCHRNTMQHFEFGLFGLLLIEPPDAYFATQVNPVIPVGHCRDGKRRTAAKLTKFFHIPDHNDSLLTAPDPWTGDPALKFATDPHAMTVAYEVEALWVLDDRDSVWSDLGSDPRATFPEHGETPGVDDDFNRKPGDQGFFAFNDFNADYWFITGVPVPCPKFGTATIDPAGLAPAGGGLPDGLLPPQLNSGVTGTQIAINAQVGQTILVRCLDAAYNSTEITFPVPVVIVAWDGRALGQPPFGFNEPYLVPAGTPIKTSTARRFDALIRATSPMSSFATVKFIDTRGQNVDGFEQVVCTARIPINVVAATPATGVLLGSDKASPQVVGTPFTFTAQGQGGIGNYQYEFWLHDGTSWSKVQAYSANNTWHWDTAAATPGTFYTVQVNVRNAGSTASHEAFKAEAFQLLSAAATGATLTTDKPSPQPTTTPGGVTFIAAGSGGTGTYEFEFWQHNGVSWTKVQAYSANSNWVWNTAAAAPGFYTVQVNVRSAGSTASHEAFKAIAFKVTTAATATGVTLVTDKPSPQPTTTPGGVTYTATGQGGSGSYEFEFWQHNGVSWSKKQAYSATNTWNWNTAAAAPGIYTTQVNVRSAGSAASYEAFQAEAFQLQ